MVRRGVQPSPSPPQRKRWIVARVACFTAWSSRDVTTRARHHTRRGCSCHCIMSRSPPLQLSLILRRDRRCGHRKGARTARVPVRVGATLTSHASCLHLIGSTTLPFGSACADTRWKMMQDPLTKCASRVPWKPTQPQHPLAFHSARCTISGNHLLPQRSILATRASVRLP